MIKTTGKEFKEFYGDDTYWPSGGWVDDLELTVNGVQFDIDSRELSEIPDTDVVRIYQGVVFYDEEGEKFTSFISFFKRWRDKCKTKTFIVAVPHTDVGILKSIVSNHKWKLI